MEYLRAIVYGIVQGLTEFLPISSTAHIRIVPSLLGWEDPGAAFTAVIQFGTVLAVLIYFARDLGAAFMAWVRSFGKDGAKSPEARMGWAIFVGTIPVVVAGLAFRHQIKSDAVRSLYVVAGSLIVMGIIMFVAEMVGKRQRKIESVVAQDGLVVGLWQCLALIPGMSRSGTTISGALFAGFDRATAARFSFLLSVPSVLGAGLFELWDERKSLSHNVGPTVLATIVSFIVGYASIAFLIKYLQKHGIKAFVIYRLALGILLLVLLQTHVLSPGTGAKPAPAAEPSASLGHTMHRGV